MNNVFVIAFDLQGTLINTDTEEDQLAMVYLIRRLKKAGHMVMVWTEGTIEDVDTAIEELGLGEYVDYRCTKRNPTVKPDIAFDDDKNALLLGDKVTIFV